MSHNLYSQLFDKQGLNTEKLEQLYGLLPIHAYYLNTKTQHVWANKSVEQYIQATTGMGMVGRTNEELLGEESADWMNKVEHGIMTGKPNKIYDDIFPNCNEGNPEHSFNQNLCMIKGDIAHLQSIKTRVQDPDGKPLGLFCMSILVNQETKKRAIINSLKQGGFSKQQAQCMYLLMRGCTAITIGERLSLSNRTVEFYINNMKKKFKCNNTPELIEYAYERYAF